MSVPAKVYTVAEWSDAESICRNYAYEAGLLRMEVSRWRTKARHNWWEGLIVGMVIVTALFLLFPATPSPVLDESLSHEIQSDTSKSWIITPDMGEAVSTRPGDRKDIDHLITIGRRG